MCLSAGLMLMMNSDKARWHERWTFGREGPYYTSLYFVTFHCAFTCCPCMLANVYVAYAFHSHSICEHYVVTPQIAIAFASFCSFDGNIRSNCIIQCWLTDDSFFLICNVAEDWMSFVISITSTVNEFLRVHSISMYWQKKALHTPRSNSSVRRNGNEAAASKWQRAWRESRGMLVDTEWMLLFTHWHYYMRTSSSHDI